MQNNPLIKVNAPVKWHTNPRSQKGPTIFDTQEEPGATGGYRLAEYPTGVVNNDDIMVWETDRWINKSAGAVFASSGLEYAI